MRALDLRRNIVRALAVLAAMPFALASGARADAESAGRSPMEIVYEGILDLEGHYARPGDTRRFHSRQRFRSDSKGDVLLDWTTWPAGDSAGLPESYLMVGNRIFQKDDPGRTWIELAGRRRMQSQRFFTGYLPIQPRTGRERSGPSREVITSWAHPRLGTAEEITKRVYTSHVDTLPDSIGIVMHERDHSWRLEAKRVSARTIPDSLLAVPASHVSAPEHPDSLRGEAVLRELAPRVWSADMEDIDSRSLVVEFQDHLAVIEAAVSSANGERLVDAVKRQWPSKPIRYALFSHHHPHYLGGLRALMAEGATIVTTPGNDSLVRAIARYPFRHPDRFARTPLLNGDERVRVLPFPARIELSDSTNHLVAINIGERSQHTAEFVLFWLPRQRILFEAEQGWFTSNGELRAGRRAAKLLEILKEENLEVDRIVQSWPMRGTEPELSVSRLADLVKQRR